MDLYLLEQIALEAQKQGNIDNVIDAFWTIFSWAGGERWRSVKYAKIQFVNFNMTLMTMYINVGSIFLKLQSMKYYTSVATNVIRSI